jgi:hypothetical protein
LQPHQYTWHVYCEVANFEQQRRNLYAKSDFHANILDGDDLALTTDNYSKQNSNNKVPYGHADHYADDRDIFGPRGIYYYDKKVDNRDIHTS